MPSLGDFFRIGLPRSFCEPWDRWVQKVMLESRAALGDAWQECYMSAPIWRFSVAGGLVGPQPARGVMMPSVDRVGRAFPLTLISDAADFAGLEDLALAALEDDMTKERLSQDLPFIAQNEGTATIAAGADWSAVVGDRKVSFHTPDLPVGAEAIRLFDPKPSEVRV